MMPLLDASCSSWSHLSLLNSFVFGSSGLEVGLSIGGVLLFSAFTVYSVNVSARGFCEYENRCCSTGAMAVWRNFAWIVQDLLKLKLQTSDLYE